MIFRREFMRGLGAGGAGLFLGHVLGGCGSDPVAPVDGGALPDAPMPGADAGSMPAGWWNSGNYAAIEDEIEAMDLEIVGSLPPEIDGLFLRNGPNPPGGRSLSWFFGDAMLHGVRLSGGRALWYRNRYIRTAALESGASGMTGFAPLMANFANTALITHAGRTLALYEGGPPHEIDPRDLSTMGVHQFGGGLMSRPVTAHPKIDPTTGELRFFGYSPFAPYLTHHVVSPSGMHMASEAIDIPGARMIHDFQITERFVLFFDLPVSFDLEAATSGGFPFLWQPEIGARIGVLPKSGTAADVRWIPIEPCYFFHTFNAYEREDGTIVLDVARHDHIWRDGAADESSRPVLYRYELDVAAGTASERALDDRIMDFPRFDPRRQSRPYRVGYGLRFAPDHDDQPKKPDALIRYDVEGGTAQVFEMGAGKQPDEPVFAAVGAGEDEGYVLTMVYDAAENRSEAHVFDATDVASGPVARVIMPRRVPFGFHGDWVPASELE